MIPQIIVLAFVAFGLVISFIEDGKDKKPGKHEFKWTVVSTTLTLSLLYWGGFFDVLFK